MIREVTKWEIEQVVNECGEGSETGKLVHELWTAYNDLENYIRTHEQEAWADLQKKLRSDSDEI